MDPAALLRWFASSARPLPWRLAPAGARDPYRTWVSEVMLQQTRVGTVLRFFDPFVDAFPDISALAAAREDVLMKRWEGLGYYRRARLLHAGARAVVERHRGELPRGVPALLELPGFGAYTAGAVASLAWNEAVPAVDGNVLRVFARQTRYQRDIMTPAARRAAEAWVRALQPPGGAGAFNEALMELGALVCAPRAPDCASCPVAASCRAPGDALPRRAARAAVPTVRVSLALARRESDGALLLEKRESGLLAGTWGLPWVEEASERALAAHVRALAGAASVRVGGERARGRHAFTHRVWDMRAFEVSVRGAVRGEWRRPEDVALGSAHRKLLSSAGVVQDLHGRLRG